jgi:hypothetical protein
MVPTWQLFLEQYQKNIDNCLVIGPKFLDDTNHNAFMKALESTEGQALLN